MTNAPVQYKNGYILVFSWQYCQSLLPLSGFWFAVVRVPFSQLPVGVVLPVLPALPLRVGELRMLMTALHKPQLLKAVHTGVAEGYCCYS